MQTRIIHILKIMLVSGVMGLSVLACSSSLSIAHQKAYDGGYQTGHQDASKFFRDGLLEVGYAEYDRKTGDWKLCDANTIQGDLIEPRRRVTYTTIDEQIHSLEDELVLLRKQQAANNKRKSDIKKSAVDFKKL